MTYKSAAGAPPARPPPPFQPSAPPPYDPQGAIDPSAQPGVPPPYGGAPPPYYGQPPNQMGYPPQGYPPQGGYQVPPNQMPQYPPQGIPPGYPPPAPGGASLYPDISQLPQPQAGTVPYIPHSQYGMAYPMPGGVIHHPASMNHLTSTLQPTGYHLPPYSMMHISHPNIHTSLTPLELPPAYQDHCVPTSRTHLYAEQPFNAQVVPQMATSGSKPNSGASLGFSGGGLTKEKSPFVPMVAGGSAPPGAPNAYPMPAGPPQPIGAVPVRPAPGPPVPAGQLTGSMAAQASWWSNLRDGEAPPGCVISWRGGQGLKIYFIQEEGHIVSPNKPLEMSVFKKINSKDVVVEESLLGMVEVVGCWRLRLHGKDSFCLHTLYDTFVFLDDSTCPRRIVIIEMPADVSKTMRQDFLALLQEMCDVREEQEGVVDKISTNVGTVYTDITKKLNTAVKDTVPGAHKSTKWLRKGAGNVLRMGGNLMSKGMHIIADQMPANQTEHQEEESPIHSELMEGLTKFRKCQESGNITQV